MPLHILVTVSLTALASPHATALPLVEDLRPAKAAMLLIADQEPIEPEVPAATSDGEELAPFADLAEALAAARARLEELTKVGAEAAAASQELQALKTDNQRLLDEVAALRAVRDELQTARQDAERRVTEMTGEVEQSAAKAERIEEELAALRRRNAQLDNDLGRAQAAKEEIEREAAEEQQELSGRVDSLTKAAEQSTAENSQLRAQLQDNERQLEAASSARKTTEQQLASVQEALQSAQDQITSSNERLQTLQSELEEAAAGRAEADARIAELQAQEKQLRAALASSEDDSDRLARDKGDLEEEVTMLRQAAQTAADAARQNLLAVEERIKELNAAIAALKGDGAAAPNGPKAAIEPEAGTEDGTIVQADGQAGAVAEPSARPPPPERPAPPEPANRATADEPEAPALAASEPEPPQAAAEEEVQIAGGMPSEAAGDGDPEPSEPEAVSDPDLDPEFRQLIAALPQDRRQQVQGLLSDLDVKPDQRGLLITLPGASLFGTDNETIEPTADDALAKAVDLIRTYDDQKVMIIGNMDSIGGETYNQQLSERRADLVKQFLVNRFEVDGGRLLTEGRGESNPVASNSTLEGRQANRRVEIVILN